MAQKLPTPQDLRQALEKYMNSRPRITLDDEGVPLPHPPRKWRDDLFKIEDFREIDQHAEEAPENLAQGSCKDLVHYLLRPCATEVEKVRVFARWIAANVSEQERTIPKVQTSKAKNFTELLHELLRSAGISCREVHGTFRNSSYETFPATWSVVCIDGDWWPLYMYCISIRASRSRSSKYVDLEKQGVNLLRSGTKERKTSDNPAYFEERYFLPDPVCFATWGFPDDPQMQLLPRTLTEQEFESICYVLPAFLKHNLKFGNQACACKEIIATIGKCKISIRYPIDSKTEFYYIFFISKGDMEGAAEEKLQHVDRFVFPEAKKDEWTATSHCPIKGKYKLELYARSELLTGSFTFVCCYNIQCYTTNPFVKPLPANPRRVWGPADDTTSFIIPVTDDTGLIEAKDGYVKTRFKLADSSVRLKHELRCPSEQDFDAFVVQEDLKKPKGEEVAFHLKLPSKGYYKLLIYGKKPDEELSSCICTYLVDSFKCTLFRSPFADGTLGLRDPQTTGIHLKKKNHVDSFMQVSRNTSLEFTTKPPAQFRSRMTRQNEAGGRENVDKFCQVQYLGKTHVAVNCRFPKVGSYHLVLEGRKSSEDPFIVLAGYTLEAVEAFRGEASYPEIKSEEEWAKGYVVHSPQKGTILPGVECEFVVEAPGDVEALELRGRETVKMKKGRARTWTGKVTAGEAGTVVLVHRPGETTSLLYFEAATFDQLEYMEVERARAQAELDETRDQRQRDDKENKAQRLELKRLQQEEDELLFELGIERTEEQFSDEEGAAAGKELDVDKLLQELGKKDKRMRGFQRAILASSELQTESQTESSARSTPRMGDTRASARTSYSRGSDRTYK